jgi:hypothetical protein
MIWHIFLNLKTDNQVHVDSSQLPMTNDEAQFFNLNTDDRIHVESLYRCLNDDFAQFSPETRRQDPCWVHLQVPQWWLCKIFTWNQTAWSMLSPAVFMLAKYNLPEHRRQSPCRVQPAAFMMTKHIFYTWTKTTGSMLTQHCWVQLISSMTKHIFSWQRRQGPCWVYCSYLSCLNDD